jgi:hypothetical protein
VLTPLASNSKKSELCVLVLGTALLGVLTGDPMQFLDEVLTAKLNV